MFHKKINKKVKKQNIQNSENWLFDDVSKIFTSTFRFCIPIDFCVNLFQHTMVDGLILFFFCTPSYSSTIRGVVPILHCRPLPPPCSAASKTSFDLTIFSQLSTKYCRVCRIWQYGLWSFQAGGTKLERFLHKNQHFQRKLLNFEFWINGELSKIGHDFSNKVI